MLFMDVNGEVKSAVRVLEVLEFLSRCPGPVAFREVVAALGFPKSSTHALLRTLVLRGYAQKDDTDRYSVAEAFRQGFGWVGGPEAQLVAMALPILEQLRADLRETVFLGVRGTGGDVKVLAKRVSPQVIRYDTEQQDLRPAYCTAMGRVLLAFWDADLVDDYFARTDLVAHTPHTVTDEAEIRGILARIRTNGYGLVEQEYVLGGSGASAPVFDRDGRVAAALNVATVAPRFPAAKDQIIATVMAAAASLGYRLGYRPSVVQAS
jgi:DNA-binding IclR family transcriptional regulator